MAEAYVCDDRTTELLRGLQKTYGVHTVYQALRRVIALNLIFARHVDERGVLRLRDMRPDAVPDATIEIPTRF